MSEAKHTAGPWHVCFTRIGKEVIYWHVADSKRGTRNAVACADEGRYKEFPSAELEANGHLIAAAPELLEAARAALEEMRWTAAPNTRFTDAVDMLDAAIAKATGDQS